MLISVIVFLQVMVTAPVFYSEQFGFSKSQIGILFAWNTLIIVAFEMVLVNRVSRFDKLRMVAIGSVFFALGTAMIPLAPGFYYAALCIVVWTIGEMLMSPLAMAWVAERAPSAAKGRYLGIFTTAFAAGNVVGPYLGMRVYEDISPAWVWYGCALLSIVIIPTFRWRPGGGRTGSPRSDIES